MTKTLNVRYLIRLTIVLVIVGVTIHFLHRRQAGKQAILFLEQAKKAEEEDNYPKMIEYYERYLRLRPDEIDTRKKLGIAFPKHSRTPEAKMNTLFFLEQIVREDPQDDTIRREAIRMAMDPFVQRFSLARTHIDFLLAKQKGDGELEDLIGQCDASERKYLEAIKHWHLAIQYRPDLVQTYGRLAYLLRKEFKEPSQADEQIEKMIRTNPNHVQAYLIRLNYWREHGDESKVDESLTKAIQLAPTDPEVLLNATVLVWERAEQATRKKQPNQAKMLRDEGLGYLRLGIEKNDPPSLLPTDPIETQNEKINRRAVLSTLYRLLVDQELRDGRVEQAEKWVRRGIEKFPEQVELIVSLVDVQIRLSKYEEAIEELKKLEKLKNIKLFIDYHKARIVLRKKQWDQGLDLLQKILQSPEIVAYRGLALRANFLLGDCYKAIDDREGRLEAYQRAIPSDPLDPLWGPATVEKANALADLGRRTEAISAYRSVIDTMPESTIPLLRLLIAETLSQSKERRDWKLVESVVSQLPDNLDRILMQNDLYVWKGEIEPARKLLEQAKEKYSDRIELAVAIALLSRAEKDIPKAETLLNEAEKKFGDKVSLRLARSFLIGADFGPEGAKRLAQLGTNTEKFFPDERKNLFTGLLDRAKLLGEKELLVQFLDRLITEDPDRLSLRFDRFDQAILANDEKTITDSLKKIQALTGGKNSPSSRLAEATHLIWKAKQDLDSATPNLRDAEKILSPLERERPNWSRVPIALGVVYDLLQNLDQATMKYQRAVDLGERNPEILQRLAELYYARNQRDQVEEILKLLPDQEWNREGLRFIAADISLELGQLDKALALARKQVNENTQDYTKQLWLAHVLFRTGNFSEVETVIRRAIDLAKDRIEPRLVLIEYFVRMEKKTQAESELQVALREVKKEDSSYLLAKSSEMLGKPDEAAKWYRKVLSERPGELPLLREAASFFLSKDIRQAERLCLQIIDQSKSESDKQFAERMLTVIISLELNPEKVKELLKIMGILDSSIGMDSLAKLSVSDLRKQALARTAQRGRKPRLDAIQLYKELERRGRLEEGDRAIMARLYHRLGNPDEAEKQYSILIGSKPKNFNYVFSSLQLVFEEGNIPAARTRLQQLEKIDPSSLRASEWIARLHQKDGNTQQGIQILQDYLTKNPESILLVAVIFDSLGITQEAEKLLIQIANDPKKPEGSRFLANFYAKHNRNTDAIGWLMKEPEKHKSTDLVNTALNVLYTLDRVEKKEIDQVKKLILQIGTKGSDLKLELAALQNLEEDYSGAIKTYQSILPTHPGYSLAINNLAFLLAYHQKNPDEALDLIERASQGRVPDPTLLDTKALILLAKKKPKEAIPILEDSIVDDPTKPTTYYHLALAYFLINDKTKAKAALDQAIKRKLRPSDLHRLEREEYEKLKQELR
jgi:cellulose synthase operon protein C